MKLNPTSLPFALNIAARIAAHSRRPVMRANPVPPDFSSMQRHSGLSPSSRPRPRLVKTESALIYAVDDLSAIGDLYQNLLSAKGYQVKTFRNRLEVLTALRAEGGLADLLITDYIGHSMPIDDFLRACRQTRMSLRVLMASGFDKEDMRLGTARPDRFLRKPFTPDELHLAVKDALMR
jgi:CheY-like chemotaxis protein